MRREERLPSTPISKLTGHNGAVHAVTYSAGLGQYILTGCSDREIRLFNPASSASAKAIQRYSTHAYAVLDLAVSADNARFTSVGGDKAVFLWDVATAQTLRRWSGHSSRVEAVAMGGVGDEVVVSGSFDRTVRIWDAKSNSYKPLMTLSEARDSVSSVAVADADILTGSVDGRVRRYDLRMGRVLTDVIGYAVTSVTPTKQHDSYLVSSLDSKVRLMDNRDGKVLQKFSSSSFTNDTYRARSTFLKGDGLVIAGSEDGCVYGWDVLSGSVAGSVWHCDQKARTDSDEGHNAAQLRQKEPATDKREVVSAVAACPARREWCSAGGDGTVVVWGG